MQLLLRYTSRHFLRQMVSIRGPALARHHFSPQIPTGARICLKCRIRVQRRHYADGIKANVSSKFPSASKGPVTLNDAYETQISISSELPSSKENRRSAVSKRLSYLMDNLQNNVFIASQRLNELTGYSGIEAFKGTIGKLEANLVACQEAVRLARHNYKKTVADRADSQREVTTLLSRKDTWTPDDVERFTSLFRSNHSNEQAVQEASTTLSDAEQAAEQALNNLSSSILIRYHEEQIWSDKIRRMSTWGTLGLMGVNVLLFLVFQFGFEPWKRQRLLRGFEEKVMAALEMEKEKRTRVQAQPKIQEELESSDGQRDGGVGLAPILTAGTLKLEEEIDGVKDERLMAETAGESETQVIGFPWRRFATLKDGFVDLFGDGIVSLRKRDIMIIALEGAAAGAAFVGTIAICVLRRS